MKVSTPQDLSALSRQLVGHFTARLTPGATVAGDAPHAQIDLAARICMEIALDLWESRDPGAKIEQLRRAVTTWARDGVSLDTAHRAVCEAFWMTFDFLTHHTDPADRPRDPNELLRDILGRVSLAVAHAYTRDIHTAGTEQHAGAQALASALLTGTPTAAMARGSGIAIATAYAVIAVHIPRQPGETGPRIDQTTLVGLRLRRLRHELSAQYSGQVLPLLGPDGGTILVPAQRASENYTADHRLDDLIEHLSAATETPLTAAVVSAVTPQVPAAADQADMLLDMAVRLGYRPGLYRWADLAAEYQLTRPGPALNRLTAVLDPLDKYPELLDTLRCHLSTHLSRRNTARRLHVHVNTVDYRLRRIRQLTGLNPAQTTGFWYLRAALIARTYQQGGTTARSESPGRAVR